MLGFCWLLGAVRGAGFFLFFALLAYLEGCWFFPFGLFLWLSVVGSFSHFLSIFNVDFCLICSLILV